MPYELEKQNGGYKLKDIKGHYYSNKPIPKKRAIAQMKAIEISKHKNDEKGGILPFLYAAYKMIPIRKDYSPKIKKLLSNIGDKPITKIVMMRTPLQKYINTALNITTLGQWSKAVRDYGYDNIFHLYCLVYIDGKPYKVEKNEIINIEPATQKDIILNKTESMNVNINYPNNLTLNSMLLNTKSKMGEDIYWKYSAFKPNNCQTFMEYFLDANGLMTPQLLNFINQNIQNITKGFIYKPTKILSDIITTTASKFRTLTGTGLI